jgi:octopine/nopaline transport system substrate-binding protein
MIPALNARKFDAIMDAMTITDERRKAIDFSDRYADSPNGFLVATDSPLAKMPGTGQAYNLSSQPAEAEKAIEVIRPFLKGKTLGVQVSTIQSAFADKYLKDSVDIREYKTVEQHDLDLTAGRLDAVFAGVTQIMGTLEKPEFKTGYALVGPSLSGGVLGGGIGIGLRKDDTRLKAKFNEAIQEAIKDGTAKTLSTKWFKVDVTPQG